MSRSQPPGATLEGSSVAVGTLRRSDLLVWASVRGCHLSRRADRRTPKRAARTRRPRIASLIQPLSHGAPSGVSRWASLFRTHQGGGQVRHPRKPTQTPRLTSDVPMQAVGRRNPAGQAERDNEICWTTSPDPGLLLAATPARSPSAARVSAAPEVEGAGVRAGGAVGARVARVVGRAPCDGAEGCGVRRTRPRSGRHRTFP